MMLEGDSDMSSSTAYITETVRNLKTQAKNQGKETDEIIARPTGSAENKEYRLRDHMKIAHDKGL